MRLFAFAVTLLSLLPLALQAQGSAVATVNGTSIPYTSYEQARLTRIMSLGRSPSDTGALDQLADDAIFLSLIDGELTLQEGAKRKIVVDRAAAIDILVANPPSYLKELFVTYDPKILRQLIAKPATITKYINQPGAPTKKIVADWTRDIEELIRYYRIEETRRRLIDSLYAASPISDVAIRHRYYAEKTLLSGSVLRVLHSNVPDAEIPITEAEARAWYVSHLEEYDIPESRRALALILPIIPSSSDTARQSAAIESVRTSILDAPPAARAARVDAALASLPPSRTTPGEMIEPSRFPKVIMQELAKAQPGDLLGPFPTDGESILLFVAGDAPSADTLIRARHILLQVSNVSNEDREYTPQQFDSALLELAIELRDSIDNEEEFIEAARYFSSEELSAGKGGDLGYAPRGIFVPEFDSAISGAPIGVPIGPVKTQFGYHLIWVVDRQSRALDMRELRFPITPSDSVRTAVMRDAALYAAELHSGQLPELVIERAAAAYPALIVDSLTYLKRLEPYADGLAASEYIFRASLGDVGIVPLPFDRLAVLKLLSIWPGGAPPYEEFAEYPIAHARRARQLDLLEKRLVGFEKTITPETLLGPIRETVPSSDLFVHERQAIVQLDDEPLSLLDSLVMVTDAGTVSGPVRGTHALYYLRILEKFAPTERQFNKEFPGFAERYRRYYREQLLEELLMDARAAAQIRDMRPSIERLLGANNR